jgi:hypothetical protein
MQIDLVLLEKLDAVALDAVIASEENRPKKWEIL